MTKFELALEGADAEKYGADPLVLDLDLIDRDTDCDALIAWEEEMDYTVFSIKLNARTRSIRWKRAVAWLALKQAGSDLSWSAFRPRGLSGIEPMVVRADPPAEAPTSSTDGSGQSS